jgi:multicomponent Na+:H+ antiporter subunit F
VIVVAVIAHALLGGGALLALVRLARGPSLLDRVVATDTLLVIISASLAVYAALTRDPTVVPVLVVVSLLAFVGSVSIARYVGGMLLKSGGDGQDAGLPRAAEERATEERATEQREARP